MSSIEIGFAGVACVLLLLAMRIPIAIALGSVSIVGIAILRGPLAAETMFATSPFGFTASWTLSAVPMFLLMGSLAYHTGLTSSLYSAARIWFGRLPGGLAIATNFACAGFAAASGSSIATAAAMGRLAIPEMLKYRYDAALATGVVAAAGTLGALIPPSITLVIYGWFAEEPVGKLLIAGIVPGVLTAVVYAVMIYSRAAANPSIAPPMQEEVSAAMRLRALLEIWPIPLLVIGVAGSIYGGIATPTEAGAIGAGLTVLIALANRGMDVKTLLRAAGEAVRTTATIFIIGIGAILFTRFLAFSGVPGFLTGIIESYAVDQLSLILAIMLIYIILGMFLDPLGLLLLTLPIVIPAFRAAGIDMIWAGILIVKFIEIGFITPPVGMNAFVIKGIVGDQISLGTIFKGLAWFVAMEILVTGILIAFPSITLFLPTLME